MTDTVVELEGVNGEWFTLAGLNEGDRGIWLGSEVTGLFDPPVKVVYEEPGNYPGARYLNHRILRRDIVFGVEIDNQMQSGSNSWLSRDSEWRKAWAFDRDCKLHVTTPESGRRTLKLRLGESPDISLKYDPRDLTMNRAGMVCIAGDPFWYEEDVVFSAITRTDTRYDPQIIPWPWVSQQPPTETLYIDVGGAAGTGALNPTDQYVFPKWTVPGSQGVIPTFPWPFPPGIPVPWELAPIATWTLPDYSFENPAQANRRLRLPGLILNENCVVDTDPRVEQVSSATGSQVWARMNGVRFRNAIPPYTEGKRFEITVSGVAAGQVVTLRIPRPWTRPWGLE